MVKKNILLLGTLNHVCMLIQLNNIILIPYTKLSKDFNFEAVYNFQWLTQK